MKVLNEMEIGMVSGGGVEVCAAPDITGWGTAITAEIGNFFAGLNVLGSELGIWLYNMTHSC